MAGEKTGVVVDPEQVGIDIWTGKKAETKADDKPKEEAKEQPKEEAKPKEEEVKAPEKETVEPTPEEKAKAEEERLLNAKDEELSEEDKPKKAELLKKQEEAKTKALEEEVTLYAKENNVSVEEARKDLDSITKLQEKYKGDPKQLAKANLHLQRLYTKSQEELKTKEVAQPEKQPKPLNDETIEQMVEEGEIRISGKVATKEKIIQAYREREPDITQALEDETVWKMAKKDMRFYIEQSHQHKLQELSGLAKEKKAKLLNELPENLKAYVPEIKSVLDLQPDTHIMNDKFTLDDFVLWAKGKHYDEDVKSFGEKEYQRGLEQAKILGEKAQPKTPPSKPSSTKTKRELTQKQKDEALNMFQSMSGSDEKKYDAYIEILEADEKRKKK